MKLSSVVSLAAALASAGLISSSAIAQTNPPPAISVTGEAMVAAPPDLAMVDAGVTTEARTAREASDANNAAMGKVLLALKGMGLEEKAYQTSRLSLQPQYQPNRTGPNAITGYRASNRVTIKLRDVAKVAALIDALTGAGANDIGGINFSVEQPSKLLDEARAEAIADARRKAEVYARAAGVTLGAPLSITEEGAPVPMRFRRMAADMAAAPQAAIATGEETLRIGVAVSWGIKPAAEPPPRPPAPVPPAPTPEAPKPQ